VTLLNLRFASPCVIIQFKSVNQLDATISQVYYLTFIYGSTCFGPTTTSSTATTTLQR